MNQHFLAPVVAALTSAAVAVLLGAGIAVHRARRKSLLRTLPKFVSAGSRVGVRGSAKLSVNFTTPLLGRVNPWLVKVGNRLVTNRYRVLLKRYLAALGNAGEGAVSAILVKKTAFAIGGLIFGFAMFYRGIGDGVFTMLLAPALGFVFPDILLLRSVRKRSAAIEKQLPDAIDLMRLCLTAGLSFESAMARISIAQDGPLAEQFAVLNLAIRSGKSRLQALTELGAASPGDQHAQFIAALIQAERLGVSIDARLAELARITRELQRSRVRENGQKVGVKLSMPLLFCFLPAMFVIVLGPAVVDLGTALGAL